MPPTVTAITATGSANLSPTAPGSSSSAAGGDLQPDVPRPLGQQIPPRPRYLRIKPKFVPGLPNDGTLYLISGGTLYGRPSYSTDGQPWPAVDGVWAKTHYNGTSWVMEVALNGVIYASWTGPTIAFATPDMISSWEMVLDPSPAFPSPEWIGVSNSLFVFSAVDGGFQIQPIIYPAWDGETLSYYTSLDGRPAYADAASFDGTEWSINAIYLRWFEEDEDYGRHWELASADRNHIWFSTQDVATPDQITDWQREGGQGFPVILGETASPEPIGGDASGDASPAAPGVSKAAAGGNLSPTAPGAIS